MRHNAAPSAAPVMFRIVVTPPPDGLAPVVSCLPTRRRAGRGARPAGDPRLAPYRHECCGAPGRRIACLDAWAARGSDVELEIECGRNGLKGVAQDSAITLETPELPHRHAELGSYWAQPLPIDSLPGRPTARHPTQSYVSRLTR